MPCSVEGHHLHPVADSEFTRTLAGTLSMSVVCEDPRPRTAMRPTEEWTIRAWRIGGDILMGDKEDTYLLLFVTPI